MANRLRENATKKMALELMFRLGFEGPLGCREDRRCLTAGGNLFSELWFYFLHPVDTVDLLISIALTVVTENREEHIVYSCIMELV